MYKNFPPLDPLRKKVNQRLLDQLYLQARKSVMALLLLSLMLSVFLYKNVPVHILYTWALIIIAITISRLLDIHYYLKHRCSYDYEKWYRKFFTKAILTAFTWGIIPFIFLPYINNISLQLFIYMLILGVGGGAMNSLAADRRIAIIYLVILLTPLSISFLIDGTMMDFAIFVTLLLYIMTIHEVNKNASSELLQSYQNEAALIETKNELFSKQAELNNLFQQTPIGVFYFDTRLRVIDSNTALADILHSTSEEIVGFDLNKLPDKRPLETIKKTLKDGTQLYRGPYTTRKGKDLWLEAKLSPLKDGEGKLIGGVGLLENKTSEKKATDELEYMARHDELTSLKNRRSFMEYMFSMITLPLHHTHYSILFYLDLNRFKQINDSMGHTVGDELLIQVANRLKSMNDNYVLSRLGGDEFTVVLPFCAKTYEDAYKISDKVGGKIQRLFSDAFIIDELHLYIKSSIGIVIIEPGTKNIGELVRFADISMYQAKREGSNNFAYYNEALDRKRKELFRLQHDLNHAIAHEELEVFYQPIVCIEDDQLRAGEALLRWNHPVYGRMLPSEFIELAIESGLIDDLGWSVIRNVCAQINEWKNKGIYKLDYISININAKQLQRYNFVKYFFDILEENDIDYSEIKLEITERSLIDNFEQTNGVIKELQRKGVRCAIDDFGIGYSSLSYLQKLAFSTLKIDREFIKDILTDEEDRFLVESIIMIAKRFNYRIVVEGIETEEQKHFIKNIDPTLRYQGYLFSPALSADEFEQKFFRKD